MYPDWVAPAVAGFLTAGLGILSFLIWKQNQFFKTLFPKSGERDIRRKFEEINELVVSFNKDLKSLQERLTEIQRLGLSHIQRVELLRFNPYDDTGGDISFTICLLDKHGTGLVITSLHARSGTRVFAKDVVAGKSSRYELSKEEELVIKKAMEK